MEPWKRLSYHSNRIANNSHGKYAVDLEFIHYLRFLLVYTGHYLVLLLLGAPTAAKLR
jgi:hypothetical protein